MRKFHFSVRNLVLWFKYLYIKVHIHNSIFHNEKIHIVSS